MKKFRLFLIFFIFVLFIFFNGAATAQAVAKPVELNFFFSQTCPHCAKEEIFLDGLQTKYPSLAINRLDIADQKNIDLLENYYQQFGVPPEQWGLVPVDFLGDKYFIGFNDNLGRQIDDYAAELLNQKKNPAGQVATSADEISVPIFGQIKIAKLSPLALSIILGTLDGFNACALVALGILLTFLVSTGLRRRVILVGGTFILTSAVVYFLFISAWFNLFSALSNVKIITYVVGFIALAFALYMLKDYFSDIICKLCDIDGKETWLSRWQKKLFTKIANLTMKQISLPILLIGVATVSAGISALELVCSFGLPLAFTKILIAQNLPLVGYYFYLLIYIVFYCLLEFIIFLAAVWTMKVTNIGGKYLQSVKLISGLVLLVLALIMLFRPGLLAL